jgi:LmbE family N-acetylglucosaminyl deacetylase
MADEKKQWKWLTPSLLGGRGTRVMVAGAHPDDPESGCAGLMAACAQAGMDVSALYLTRGEAGIADTSHDEAARIRTAEATAACSILGVRPLFLGQIDGATLVNTAWFETTSRMIQDECPDVVFTQWPLDTHNDHRMIALLVYEAWLRADRCFQLWYYEVESGGQTQHFHPTHYLDMTAFEDRKRAACYAHVSQNPEDDFYAWHNLMHKVRGRECGVAAAEAYILHDSGPDIWAEEEG